MKWSSQTDFGWNGRLVLWNGRLCPLSADRKEANIPSYSSKNIAVGRLRIAASLDTCPTRLKKIISFLNE